MHWEHKSLPIAFREDVSLQRPGGLRGVEKVGACRESGRLLTSQGQRLVGVIASGIEDSPMSCVGTSPRTCLATEDDKSAIANDRLGQPRIPPSLAVLQPKSGGRVALARFVPAPAPVWMHDTEDR
jgi:hypothetical protein